VNLCGHATLATAHTLFSELKKRNEDIHSLGTLFFNTLSGELSVKLLPDGKLQMNFPQGITLTAAHPCANTTILGKPAKIEMNEALLETLLQTLKVEGGKSSVVEIHLCPITKKLVVEVNSFQIIKKLNPNFAGLTSIDFGEHLVRGIIVTTKGLSTEQAQQYDFASRYFAPWVGIDEDPVTGSAHCVLAAYWSKKLNKTSHRALQASERAGELDVELLEETGRVLLSGYAVTVLQGSIRVN
jgi:PhzF family phenazine biosynthesis protein